MLVAVQMLISGMPGGKGDGDKKKAPPSSGKGGGPKAKQQQASPA